MKTCFCLNEKYKILMTRKGNLTKRKAIYYQMPYIAATTKIYVALNKSQNFTANKNMLLKKLKI